MSWRVCKQEEQNYLIQCLCERKSFNIKITNMVQFWSKSFSDEEAIDFFEQQNPLVEAPEESLVKHVQTILDISKSKVEIVLEEKSSEIFLKFFSKFQGIPLTLGLRLELVEPTVLFNEVTVPLLLTVQNLQAQQKYLFDLLKKKDVEINEYKLQGFQLARKSIETSKFNENVLAEVPVTVDNSSSSEILNVLSQSTTFAEVCNLLILKKNVTTESPKTALNVSAQEETTKEDSTPENKKRKFNP